METVAREEVVDLVVDTEAMVVTVIHLKSIPYKIASLGGGGCGGGGCDGGVEEMVEVIAVVEVGTVVAVAANAVTPDLLDGWPSVLNTIYRFNQAEMEKF